MTSPEGAIARVTAEVTAGRLSRAREILAGRIAGGDADPAILEAHGRVLQAMGEQVEAGRYLFASGVRGPAYADAIALFVFLAALGVGLVTIMSWAVRVIFGR